MNTKTQIKTGDTVKVVASHESLPSPQYLFAGQEGTVKEISGEFIYVKFESMTDNHPFYDNELTTVTK